MASDLHRSIYVRYLRAAKRPEEFIRKLEEKYEYVDAGVIAEICNDDLLCGLGILTFGSSPECGVHDLETLANAKGYPVTTNSETALKFTLGTVVHSVDSPRNFLLTIPKAIIGSTVGWAMWLGRLAIRVRRKNGTNNTRV